MAIVWVVMPPSNGASTDSAAVALAESALAGEAGANGLSATDRAGWREIGRAPRSSGSPNPTRLRWTGLTGVAPMLPTERATVGPEPRVGAGLSAKARPAVGVAAVVAGAVGEGWRWTDGPTWRCATAGRAVPVCAGAAGAESVAPASSPTILPTGAPKPARRDWPRVSRGAGAASRETIGAAVLASVASRAPGKNGTFGVASDGAMLVIGAGAGLGEGAAALR